MEKDKGKPYKICDSRRSKTKGIVVASLEELKDKACSKLGISTTNIRVFLENDGTEIEDEDYFGFLEDHTKLMVVSDGERWNAGVESYSQPNSGSFGQSLEMNESLEIDKTDAGDMANNSPELLIRMKSDPAFFVSFSDENLQLVVDWEMEELAASLACSIAETKHRQEACQQELDRRTQLREATQLLKLYDKARQYKEELANKRPRTDS